MSPPVVARFGPAFVALLLAACGSSNQSVDGSIDAPQDVVGASDAHADTHADVAADRGIDVHIDVRPDIVADNASDIVSVDTSRDVTGTDTVDVVIMDTPREASMCPASCTTNAECAASCPAPPSGSSACCTFGVCSNVAGTCGGMVDAGGMDANPLCMGLIHCRRASDCVPYCGATATCVGNRCY